jgi:hypothetical protein
MIERFFAGVATGLARIVLGVRGDGRQASHVLQYGTTCRPPPDRGALGLCGGVLSTTAVGAALQTGKGAVSAQRSLRRRDQQKPSHSPQLCYYPQGPS